MINELNVYRSRIYANYSQHYERANPFGTNMLHYYTSWYGKILPLIPPGSTVLDIGCGYGDLLNWVGSQGEYHLTGIDLSPTQIESLRSKYPKIEAHLGDAQQYLLQQAEAYNLVFCNDVLEHLTKIELFEWMDAIRQALKPGGYLCYRVPNAANLTGIQLRYADMTHEQSFTSFSIQQLHEACGLEHAGIFSVCGSSLLGKLRNQLNHRFHQALYYLSGCGNETVFSRTMICLCRRPSA